MRVSIAVVPGFYTKVGWTSHVNQAVKQHPSTTLALASALFISCPDFLPWLTMMWKYKPNTFLSSSTWYWLWCLIITIVTLVKTFLFPHSSVPKKYKETGTTVLWMELGAWEILYGDYQKKSLARNTNLSISVQHPKISCSQYWNVYWPVTVYGSHSSNALLRFCSHLLSVCVGVCLSVEDRTFFHLSLGCVRFSIN